MRNASDDAPPKIKPIDLRTGDAAERETILKVMSASAFIIFFQAYLVAPLIPALAVEFHTSAQFVGLLIPAYLLPYGFSTLFYGPLSDRIGRKPILLVLLALIVAATAGAATARTMNQLLVWRIVGGVASGGIIPIALALLGDLFPYEQRGRPLGWIFGAIAGGSAFGSTCGAVLYPFIGWRSVFVAVAAGGAVVVFVAFRHRQLLDTETANHPLGIRQTIDAYLTLLKNRRGGRTYACIFLNGVFHAGVFSWLGFYFSQRFGLKEVGIGLALLGYGIPGLLLGPFIGHLADRVGRRSIVPVGMLIAGLCAAALIPHVPLAVAAVIVTLLSLGFDMSHPLLAGIITSLDPKRRGAAMGINAFVLFTGFGLGSLIFQLLLRSGFPLALGVFAIAQIVLSLAAIKIFQQETANDASAQH